MRGKKDESYSVLQESQYHSLRIVSRNAVQFDRHGHSLWLFHPGTNIRPSVRNKALTRVILKFQYGRFGTF